jgi:hypothetical protein
MRIKLSDKRRALRVAAIQAYFRDELYDDVGELKGGLALGLFEANAGRRRDVFALPGFITPTIAAILEQGLIEYADKPSFVERISPLETKRQNEGSGNQVPERGRALDEPGVSPVVPSP